MYGDLLRPEQGKTKQQYDNTLSAAWASFSCLSSSRISWQWWHLVAQEMPEIWQNSRRMALMALQKSPSGVTFDCLTSGRGQSASQPVTCQSLWDDDVHRVDRQFWDLQLSLCFKVGNHLKSNGANLVFGISRLGDPKNPSTDGDLPIKMVLGDGIIRRWSYKGDHRFILISYTQDC